MGALWQKRRFATRFELLYPSRESRKRDAAIRLIPKKTRGRAALPLTACFLSLCSSQQGDGRQAARFTCRQALVHLLLLFPKNLTPLRALRFSGAPLLRALIPLCAQIHSFRVCPSAYRGQKQKVSFLLLQIIVSAHENLGELSPAVFRDLGGQKRKLRFPFLRVIILIISRASKTTLLRQRI